MREKPDWSSLIARAASWHMVDTPEYKRYSKNFEEATADLTEHAKAKKLEAATMDYVRLTISCVQCHEHIRDVAAKGK